MKAIYRIIKLTILVSFILGVFILLTNKTFIYTFYKMDDMESSGISIPRFYYLSNKTPGKFYTIVKKDKIESNRDKYLDSLESCYGVYWYDKENNITITNYTYQENGVYNTILIDYVKDNYCSENYILSDTWFYDYNELSSLESSSISEQNVIKLIDVLHESIRNINPVITNYKSKVSIILDCSIGDINYILEIKDFSDKEIIVIKSMGDSKTFSVYNVDNAVSYLEGLGNEE